MQNYSNPAARNEKAAAGVKPGMVSVKYPEKANSPAKSGAAKPKAPAGFVGGVIPGKV